MGRGGGANRGRGLNRENMVCAKMNRALKYYLIVIISTKIIDSMNIDWGEILHFTMPESNC